MKHLTDEELMSRVSGGDLDCMRLHMDENVNVRMAAAEALWKFRQEEMVKQALIKSLDTEKNPDVQILVIQFLSETQEKRAVQPMQKLLIQPDLEPYVKVPLKSTENI